MINELEEYLEKSKDLFPSLSFLDFLDPIEPYFSKGSRQQYVVALWLLRILFYAILAGCLWLTFFGDKQTYLQQLAINISAGMIAFLFARPIGGGISKWRMWFLLIPGLLIAALLFVSSKIEGPISDFFLSLACNLCLVVALDLLFQRFIDNMKEKFGIRS
jgi:hypothetical protein